MAFIIQESVINPTSIGMSSNQTEGFNDSLSENDKMGGVKKKTPLSIHLSNAAIFISKL